MASKTSGQITLEYLIQELKRQLLPVLSTPKRYLTEGEASHYLGVSVHTLRQWRSRGEKNGPPYLKIGTCVRYDVQNLDAWMGKFKVKQ